MKIDFCVKLVTQSNSFLLFCVFASGFASYLFIFKQLCLKNLEDNCVGVEASYRERWMDVKRSILICLTSKLKSPYIWLSIEMPHRKKNCRNTHGRVNKVRTMKHAK